MADNLDDSLRELAEGSPVEEVIGRLFGGKLGPEPYCTRCQKRKTSGYAYCDVCRSELAERLAGLKRAGCCVSCKKPIQAGAWCGECLNKSRVKREDRKANGRCTRCNGVAIPGQTRCETCKAFDDWRIQQLKKDGYCVGCHTAKAREGKATCEPCSRKRLENVRKWREAQKAYKATPLGLLEVQWKKSPADWTLIGQYYRELRKTDCKKKVDELLTSSFDRSVDTALAEFLNAFSFIPALVEGKSYSFARPARRNQYVQQLQLRPGWTALATKLGQPLPDVSGTIESLFVLFRTPTGYALNISHIRGLPESDGKIRRHELSADVAQYVSYSEPSL
jgi:hypothetical protein